MSDKIVSLDAPKPNPWVCHACGAVNESGALRCGTCGRSKSILRPKKVPVAAEYAEASPGLGTPNFSLVIMSVVAVLCAAATVLSILVWHGRDSHQVTLWLGLAAIAFGMFGGMPMMPSERAKRAARIAVGVSLFTLIAWAAGIAVWAMLAVAGAHGQTR